MFKNSPASYGLIAIILHWLMALTIFGLFGLGLYMVELTYYDSWYKGLQLDLHKSIGLTLAAVFLLEFYGALFRLNLSHWVLTKQ